MIDDWEVLTDGTLFSVPSGGRYPAVPEGYERAPWGDKCYAIPKIVDCEARQNKEIVTACCKYTILFCNIINKEITRGICKNCGANKQWILDSLKKSG